MPFGDELRLAYLLRTELLTFLHRSPDAVVTQYANPHPGLYKAPPFRSQIALSTCRTRYVSIPLYRCRTATVPLQALEQCLAKVSVSIQCAAELPVATAHACLPLWLEAAGWIVVIAADAAAAAMGTWWQQQGQEQPTSSSNSQVRVYRFVDVWLACRMAAMGHLRPHL